MNLFHIYDLDDSELYNAGQLFTEEEARAEALTLFHYDILDADDGAVNIEDTPTPELLAGFHFKLIPAGSRS